MESAGVRLFPPTQPADSLSALLTRRILAQGLAPIVYTAQAKLVGISEGEMESQQLQHKAWNEIATFCPRNPSTGPGLRARKNHIPS